MDLNKILYHRYAALNIDHFGFDTTTSKKFFLIYKGLCFVYNYLEYSI